MTFPLIHRGIHITRAEVPGASYEWTHDETNAHGMAPDIETAIAQIDLHLGSPVPTSAAPMPVTSTTPTVADLVAVKPLEWKPAGYDGQSLEASALGLEVCFRVHGKPGDWTLTSPGAREYVHTPGYETRADATAAAQTDFERRIFAALSPAATEPVEDAATIRCNQCGWEGIEDDLIASLDKEDGEPSKPCPTCGTDNYLMDMDADAVGTISTTRHPVVRYQIGYEVGDVFGRDSGYDGLTPTVEVADHADAQTMLAAISSPSPVTVAKAALQRILVRASEARPAHAVNALMRIEALAEEALRALAGEKS